MSKNIFKNILFASIIFSVGSLTAVSEIYISKGLDYLLPETSKIKNFKRLGTITLLAKNGEIIQKIGPATREKVYPGKMPLMIEKAFIAAEDRRFYMHDGVDFWGVIRAASKNLRQISFEEGASTITQQLARIVYLSQDKTITRKVKEAALAFKIERELSKEEILLKYLNNVYLGSSAYGISDAAWVYFSKTPDLLTLSETALIAGLAPAPSLYSPLVNKDLAIKRRNIVLQRMQHEGFISQSEFKKAINSEITLKTSVPKYFNSAAPFFSSWLFQELPKILTEEQIEIGGLTIRTSLNLEWQLIAREIIQTYSPKEIEAALVAIEPNSGFVRVLIGGKDFNKNQFNRATQALRSPGSTFKIFIYLAALIEGIKPNDIFLDHPKCWYGYCPNNFGNKYLGEIKLIDALRTSSNTIAVQLLDDIGFKKIISIANKLGIGIESELGNYYPLAIGALEETVINMTAAYASIINEGLYIKPTPFEEIKGPNNIILWSKNQNHIKGEQTIPKPVAQTLVKMLKTVVKDGTGIAASLPNRPVAGKTGTSEGNRDLWFIGSLPELTTGVWLGNDNNKVTTSSSGNAALTWRLFVQKIEKDLTQIKF